MKSQRTDQEDPATRERPPVEQLPLLVAAALTKIYRSHTGWFQKAQLLRAVDNVSLEISQGEVLGIVGESGSGKSTLGLLLQRLIEPTLGGIFLKGEDLVSLPPRASRHLRRTIQLVLEDPRSALDPKQTVHQALTESLKIHRFPGGKAARSKQAYQLIEQMGLSPEVLTQYPRTLSSGACQLVNVARALAASPQLLICDELLGGLDPATQVRLLDLLKELNHKDKLAILYMSHNVRVVCRISHRVLVLYMGRVVESGAGMDVAQRRLHPYTRTLFASARSIDPDRHRLRVVTEGPLPDPLRPPDGCAFHPRCPRAQPGLCSSETPPLRPWAEDASHWVACHFPSD